MNEQEKVYKVIQAAVKKLQDKGVEINEEQFVQLIQDTYKKAATKEEGDKAVKDMFAEIFKDEQKMFKDGGKMESAVNLFKCGGKSKSKASKKVRKGQEGLEFYGQNYIKRPGGGYFVYGTDLSNPDYSSDDKYMMIDLDKPGDNIGVKISGNDTIPLMIPKTRYTRNEGKVVSDPTLKKVIIDAVERENQIYYDVDPIIGQKAYGSDIYGRTVTVPGQKGRYNMFEDDNIRYESVETPDGRVVKVVDENDLPPGYYNRPIFYDGHGVSEYGLKNQDSLRTVFETLLKDTKTYPHVGSYKYFYDNYRKSKKKVDKKQNGGYIKPDVSTPDKEILYKHHPGTHTPLIGFREKSGKYV